jgi:hypothetical protein
LDGHAAEDGGSEVLQNVGILPHHSPKDRNLTLHCHENQKSWFSWLLFINQPLHLTTDFVFLQLLNSERLSIFAADLQVSFLLFEALRTHLKFQLEFYLTRVIDIIISDSPKITYEQKEIALGNAQCSRMSHSNIFKDYQCLFFLHDLEYPLLFVLLAFFALLCKLILSLTTCM